MATCYKAFQLWIQLHLYLHQQEDTHWKDATKWIETMVTSYGMRNTHSCTTLCVNRIEHLHGMTQRKGNSDLISSLQSTSQLFLTYHSSSATFQYHLGSMTKSVWLLRRKSTQAFMNHPTLPTNCVGFVYWRKMEHLCELHYNQAFRSTSDSRTPCRAVRRSFMWCNARPLCWIWWATNRRIIMRLYNFPNTLWSIATCHPTNGLDKFSPYFSWWCHLHPSAWNPTSHNPLHWWHTGQRTKVMLHPGRWFVRNNSTESRNSLLCLGTLYQLESHSSAHEILRRDLLWQEAMALCSKILGHRALLHLWGLSCRWVVNSSY